MNLCNINIVIDGKQPLENHIIISYIVIILIIYGLNFDMLGGSNSIKYMFVVCGAESLVQNHIHYTTAKAIYSMAQGEKLRVCSADEG